MIAAFVAAVLTYAIAALAQQEPAPPVQGLVVSADTGTPIAGARVAIGVGARDGDPVRTDDRGRFAVPAPVTTAYDLRVTKAGFLPVRVTPPDSLARAIGIRLVRSSAIAGHLYNAKGEPMPDAAVTVRPIGDSAIREPTPPARTAQTDDLGAYRVGGLESGRYVVAASSNLVTAGGGVLMDAVPQRLVQLRPGQESVIDLMREPPAVAVPSFPPGTTQAKVITLISPDDRQTVVTTTNAWRGAIAGRVTDPSGRLDSVRLQLESVADGTGRRYLAMTSADATGRYEFGALQAGTYTVTVQVPNNLVGRGGLVRSAVIRNGERLDGFDFEVPLSSVITGTIIDDWGDPVEGLSVQAWRLGISEGRPVVQPAETARARRTDDRGTYRIYGLLPGTYYVVAIDEASGEVVSNLGLKAKARRYAPGTPSLAQAAPLRVDRGQELSGVNIRWEPLRGARIGGIARLSTGEPVNGTALLMVSTPPGAPVSFPQAASIGSGGTFEFRDVPPGEYVVQVLAKRQWGVSEEFGTRRVSVQGAGTAALTIVTAGGSSMTGRIVFEGGPAPATSSGFHLTAHPSDPEASPAAGIEGSLTARAQIRPNWEFQMTNLFGANRIAAQAPEGWWLKSITIDGINAADDPYTFTSGRAPSDVEILFVRGTATLAGRLMDANNQPVPDHPVVVLSTDPSRIYPGSRHMALARTAQDGSFALSAVPPGDYWIAPMDAADAGESPDEWQNPDALNRALPSAVRVTLTGARRASVVVRTGG
jgi:hypothetical protein